MRRTEQVIRSTDPCPHCAPCYLGSIVVRSPTHPFTRLFNAGWPGPPFELSDRNGGEGQVPHIRNNPIAMCSSILLALLCSSGDCQLLTIYCILHPLPSLFHLIMYRSGGPCCGDSAGCSCCTIYGFDG